MTVQRVLQSALLPLAALYEAASYFDGRRKQRRAVGASLPVISVGNISAGGTGKTPVVELLASRLQMASDVLILSRGYGRRDPAPRVWRSGDALPDPSLFGDEPALLARVIRRGGIAVASDRARLLHHLENSFKDAIVLLDDGFQHRRLQRDLDIVIVDDATASIPHRLLPAGRLRERPGALGRAGLVLASSAAARALARKYLTADRIFDFRVAIEGIEPWREVARPASGRSDRKEDHALDGDAVPAPPDDEYESRYSELSPAERSAPRSHRDIVLVTGIARPARLADAIASLGAHITEHIVFADHKRYRPVDVRRIEMALDAHPGTMLVTTSKDAVKLEKYQQLKGRLNWIVPRVDIDGEERFLRIVNEHIRAKLEHTPIVQNEQ